MKRVLALLAVFLLAATNLHAGNGDLIVDGNVGIGTTNPPAVSLDVLKPAGSTVARFYNNGTNGGTGYAESPVLAVSSKTFGGAFTAGHAIFSVGRDNTYSNTFNISDTLFTVLGNGNVGIGTTDPQFTLDIAGSGRIETGIWQTSDIKFKKDILPIDSALDKVLKLSGISFEWIQDKKDKEDELIDSSKTDDNGSKKDEKDKIHPEDGRHYGVIAQEIEKVLPEIVKEDNEGNKAVAYMEIIPVLIEAMKEQQKQITSQQKEIEQLKNMISKSR